MVLCGIISYILSYCIFWVFGKVVMIMCCCLFGYMMGMLVVFFDKQFIGMLLLCIIYDFEQVVFFFFSVLIIVVCEGVLIIGLFVMMFYYSWQLLLILIVLVLIVLVVICVVFKCFCNISKNMQNMMGQVIISVEQMLKGYKEVLMFGGQEVEIKCFDKVSNKMCLQGMKMVFVLFIFDLIIQFIVFLVLVFVLYVVSFLSVMDILIVGIIIVVFFLMIVLMCLLKLLINVNVQFQCGMVVCQMLFVIFDFEQEKDEGMWVIEWVKGNFKFENVIFIYLGCEVVVLCNINFDILEGKIVVLVGCLGLGKLIIVSLIICFYDVDEGQILLDGYDLCEYKLSLLCDQVVLVL